MSRGGARGAVCRRTTWGLLVLGGCTATKPEPDAWEGLYDADPLNPFPSAELVVDGHVAIPADTLAVPEGGTPLDVGRLNWRRGFSPVQPSVWRPSQPLDPATIGGQGDLGVDGSIRMWDLDTGAPIPCFAELDAYPEAVATGERVLIVRPMVAVPDGHTVAVVVGAEVAQADGAPLSHAEWDEAVAADAHTAALADRLAALGETDVALAWDYPVGDATTVLDAVVPAVAVPTTWTIDEVDTEGLPEGVARVGRGRLRTTNWLVDDRGFVVVDGLPSAQGEADADLYLWMPTAAASRKGPRPVIVFGHGILEDPAHYLEDDADSSAVIDVANRLGAVVVATTWRGLTRDDLVDAVNVANNFGDFPDLTDRMTQGVANTLALVKAVSEGGLLDDPFFEGRADRDHLLYYGISLGGIEGAVLQSQQQVFQHAVLHVGGSDWSTMLERSSNWPAFEAAIVRTVPDPGDRQLLYAVSQLLWDPVDPAVHAEALRGRSILWQMSIGDNQVPNLTTELLARSAGVPLADPAFTTPYGLERVALPTTGPVLVQFDPQLGVPDPVNRPAADTGAHDLPRLWEGTRAQTVLFLTEGTAENFCGATGCDATHPGG